MVPYVHYYNRGVNKGEIFFSENNYEYLKNLFFRFLPEYRIELLAYCLLPNHYHILLKHEKAIDGSRYIQRVFNAYTQGINRKLNRIGTLFQGNVKKRYIEDENYLRETIKYIHFNPVTAHLTKKPEDWIHSDYREWIGLNQSTRNLSEERNLIFGSAEGYKEKMNLEVEKLKDLITP